VGVWLLAGDREAPDRRRGRCRARARRRRGGEVVSSLKHPLKDGLRDPADEAAVSRMWQTIDARFPKTRRTRSVSLIMAPLVEAAAGLAVVAFLRRDPGPLRMADGSAIVAVDAPAGGARLTLSDGSA